MFKTAIHSFQERVLALLARGVASPTTEAEFDGLARTLFALQFANNPAYRAHCEHLNIAPPTIGHWKQIPAVPTSAFKHFPITCFPPENAVAEFHTSGTTAAQAGKHFFATLDLYEAAIRPQFVAHLLPDNARLPMFGLMPSLAEAPHSSLAHMLGVVMREFGTAESKFFVTNGQLQAESLARALCETQWDHAPVFLLGTAFAFVHFADYCAAHALKFDLADGSRVMETGGFKGRSRELTKRELYALIEQALGVPAPRIVNEYGMTELSTQFYDQTLRRGQSCDLKTVPPWARVLIIDPTTGRETNPGERGVIRVFDLANVGSAFVIDTEDLGIAQPDGSFELLGRATGAEVRGCSLNAEMFTIR